MPLRAAGLLLGTLLLGGCAHAYVTSGTGEQETAAARTACPAGPAVHLPHVPPRVVTALVCSIQVRPVPGDGNWQVQVVQRVAGGLGPLLRAYAGPDRRHEDACAAVA